jgi:phenylacetate-CoA ligase
MDTGSIIARRLLLPALRWKNGRRRVNHFLHDFERTQGCSADELRDLQLRRLQAVLRHAYDHSAYYRRRFQEAGITPAAIRDSDDLRKLPALSKDELRAHVAELIADNCRPADLRRDETGGSTGSPVAFYRDRRCGDARMAVGYRHDRWTGWDIGERVSYIWGARRDLAPMRKLRWRMSSRFLHRHTVLDAAALDADTMGRFARELGRWRPALVIAYAGAAYVFAKFLLERGITVPPPKGVITSAELLAPHQRQVIEQSLGAPVFNRYGAREVGLVASECHLHQGLHVAIDSLHVEVLADGVPAAAGSPGEVVITDLHNYGMPLIRYRLGDVVMPSDRRCDCGRALPLLEMVSGRTSDFLVTPGGRLVSGAYLTIVTAQCSGVEQVQFVQEAADDVLIKIVAGPGFTAADLRGLGRKVGELMGSGVTVRTEVVAEIPKERGGKHRFCVRRPPVPL